MIFRNGGNTPEGTPGTVTANAVRLRSASNTSSAIVSTLSSGTTIYVTESVTGEKVSSGGESSNIWYKATTTSGAQGYISALFVKLSGEVDAGIAAPTISVDNNQRVSMATSSENAAIYYTTDCSTPSSENGTIYNSAIVNSKSTTYKAVTIHGDKTSKVSVLTVMDSGPAFTDLSTEQWYFGAVEGSVRNKYFAGNGDGTFAPNKTITRAQFVTVLANIEGADLEQYTGSSFKDVKEGSWYAKAVAWSKEKGYIEGYDDGNFKPDEALSREQLCVIFERFYKLETDNIDAMDKFADHDSISDWATNAVYTCKNFGIIQGQGGNMFAPKKSATRAETATILANIDGLEMVSAA